MSHKTYQDMYNRIVEDMIAEYQANRPFCPRDEAEAEILKDKVAISRVARMLVEDRAKIANVAQMLAEKKE